MACRGAARWSNAPVDSFAGAARYPLPQAAGRVPRPAAVAGSDFIKSGCINLQEKPKELAMSDDALNGLFWTGVVVLTLAVLIVWYMAVRI
jgi:hypothetical protein